MLKINCLDFYSISLVCLFGFNVAFKHPRSYHDGDFLWQWYFDQCAATQECHAADTGHDTPSRHSIQTQGRPVAVLSIDVERHTGIHTATNLNVLGKTRPGNHPPTFPTVPTVSLKDKYTNFEVGLKCIIMVF